jgi:hypothetical protein
VKTEPLGMLNRFMKSSAKNFTQSSKPQIESRGATGNGNPSQSFMKIDCSPVRLNTPACH